MIICRRGCKIRGMAQAMNFPAAERRSIDSVGMRSARPRIAHWAIPAIVPPKGRGIRLTGIKND